MSLTKDFEEAFPLYPCDPSPRANIPLAAARLITLHPSAHCLRIAFVRTIHHNSCGSPFARPVSIYFCLWWCHKHAPFKRQTRRQAIGRLCRVVDNALPHPTPRQSLHNLYDAGLTHVFLHRSGGHVRHICSTHHKVRNHWELLRIAVQQLVEEVRTGSHRFPDPGCPNQHTRMRRKVLLRTTAKPLGCIAFDNLPHSLHLTVNTQVTSGSILPPRVRPSLVRGKHHQPGTRCTGLLHSVILFNSLANCLVRPWLFRFPLLHFHSRPFTVGNLHDMAPPRILQRLVASSSVFSFCPLLRFFVFLQCSKEGCV
ncbi:hypothetical protein TCDM_13167 [Trypanosoma cruzi Dm28c]|uniref:Uncharacterized protein n=1 Tax=Trypanosoma cruzi Dm28c TaxID=1416333 RepID=V5CJ17_TRYCR|nr:hypothetical protein TCDM_13167 [Trypanosoma cruzi Dm28c]